MPQHAKELVGGRGNVDLVIELFDALAIHLDVVLERLQAVALGASRFPFAARRAPKQPRRALRVAGCRQLVQDEQQVARLDHRALPTCRGTEALSKAFRYRPRLWNQ